MIKNYALGKYKGLEIKKDEIVVSENEIQQMIKEVRTHRSKREEKLGPVKHGDHVFVTYDCIYDGIKYDSVSGKNVHLKVGGDTFDVKFEENLLNRSKGEKYTFEFYADDNFSVNELQGKLVEFEVELLKVEADVTPALDDTFVQSLNSPNLKTVDDFIFSTRREIFRRKEMEQQVDLINEIMKTILDGASTEYDDSLIEKEMHKLVDKLMLDLEEKGLTMDIFLEHEKYDSKEAFWEEGIVELKTQLLEEKTIMTIAELENISIVDKEYNEVLDKYLLSRGMDKEAFDDHDEFRKSLHYKKVIEYLLLANVSE